MEIPSVVDSGGHSVSGSQTFPVQELNPEIPALSEKEHHCAHVPLQEHLPLGNDEEIQNRSLEFACQGSTESSQQAEPMFLSLGESPVEVTAPLSAAVSHDSCCSGVVALPISAPKGWSDNPGQNTAAQLLSCEPKGRVGSLEYSPDAVQNFLPVPKIVKHEQSSITFLDHCEHEGHSFAKEGSGYGEEQDGGQYHDADENDDYDDDVFNELPVRPELLVNNSTIHRKMRSAESLELTINCGCDAEEEVSCSLRFQNALFRKTGNITLSD